MYGTPFKCSNRFISGTKNTSSSVEMAEENAYTIFIGVWDLAVLHFVKLILDLCLLGILLGVGIHIPYTQALLGQL